jgi:transposase
MNQPPKSVETVDWNTIPTEVTEAQFQDFFLPFLSLPKRGPTGKIPLVKIFNAILYVRYTGCQWKMLPIEGMHSTSVFRWFRRWVRDGSLKTAFIERVRRLHQHQRLDLSVLHGDGTNTIAKKGGEAVAYTGHKRHTGSTTLGVIDNAGNVLGTMAVTAASIPDIAVLSDTLDEVRGVIRAVGLPVGRIPINLDAGFDSRANRKKVFNGGLRPNMKENPRHRTSETPKRGRPRLWDAVVYALRFAVERTFAWEDTFRRVLIRFETRKAHFLGFKHLAYTLINLRSFVQE